MGQKIMPTRYFFRLSLGLPLVLAAFGLLPDNKLQIAQLTLVASPAYILLAIWACHKIRRARNMEQILTLTLAMPLLFSGILFVVCCFFGFIGLAVGMFAAGLGLLMGYGFVAVSWTLYAVLKRARILIADVDWTAESA
jgi:hypothetical protein